MRGLTAGSAIVVCVGVLGAQQFVPWSRLQLPQSSDSAARFVDLDGDGDLDILGYSTSGRDVLHVYENVGYGHFRVDPRFTPVTAYVVGWFGPLVGDIDGDGLQDVVTADVVVRNRGALGPIAVPHNLGGTAIALGDFNGDGRQDIVTYSGFNGSFPVRVWLAGPGFTFSPPILLG